MKKRVYFWGGISWDAKTPGVAWTAADIKVSYKHTKNLCVDTLFADVEDETGEEIIAEWTEQSMSRGLQNFTRLCQPD